MTDCDRILEALRRGPQTAQALYGLHCIAHSRISDLRRRGFVITLTRLGGTGPESYLYTLEAEPVLAERETNAVAGFRGTPPEGETGRREDKTPTAQAVVPSVATVSRSASTGLSAVESETPQQLALIPAPERHFDRQDAA